MDGFFDDLAIIEVLVDDAFRRSVEGVAEQSRGVLRQGADPQPDRAYRIETFGQMRTDDADEPRRHAGLRGHDAF